MITVGLRVDVDTLRGTRIGVPKLNELFSKHSIHATYFFSVGPDNMGRHLFRLLKPEFLKKMLRTKASKLYGWDILLKGTLWPGPIIGKRERAIIKSTADLGHEVGLHAWDHHAWQAKIDVMSELEIKNQLARGYSLLKEITGSEPKGSAAPSWKCTENALKAKQSFPFLYNSDCRGTSVFVPSAQTGESFQPQVPNTLPTFDEVFGANGISEDNYNEYLFSLMEPNSLQVLTIHAECEGIAYSDLFDNFLTEAKKRNIKFVTLESLVPENPIPKGSIKKIVVPGREGWISEQAA